MLNLPSQHYDRYPYARRALSFLKGAQTTYEPTNRYIDFWVVSYYLLSHSVELSIKAVIKKKLELDTRGHNIISLARRYTQECNFSQDELAVINQLANLNSGSGGLRYDNIVEGDFLPFTFRDGVKIIERLFEENFQ